MRILIADDDAVSQRILQEAVTGIGHEVILTEERGHYFFQLGDTGAEQVHCRLDVLLVAGLVEQPARGLTEKGPHGQCRLHLQTGFCGVVEQFEVRPEVPGMEHFTRNGEGLGDQFLGSAGVL